MRRQLLFILIILTVLTACSHTKQTDEQTTQAKNVNHFPNVIKAQQFGDTVRIEIEKRGDTIINHYIDLKGASNDNFDDSYNTTCTYKEVKNDITINSNFYIVENDYRLYFDSKRILAYCDSILKGVTSDIGRVMIQPYYEDLKKRVLHKTDAFLYCQEEEELILNFSCKIVNQKTNEKPQSILVEFYRTEWSGGKNFFVITGNGDTVGLFYCEDLTIE